MTIEHIAIWTSDLERMRAFYQSYFNMTCNNKYENKEKNFASYFLSFENGSRIEIMTKPNVKHQNNENDCLIGYAHFAISVGGKSKVDELTERLRLEGVIIYAEPRTTGDGYYESVILDPDGNKIEITE